MGMRTSGYCWTGATVSDADSWSPREGWLLANESRRFENNLLGAQNIRCEGSFRSAGPVGSPCLSRSGESARRVRLGCGAASVGSARLVLEVLLWLVGRYSEQGVMLHVCKMVLRHRLFRMTWLEVGARRALRAVGGAWRDSATMCYSGLGAGRSAGVLPGPVALRALEVASYRRSRRQGSGSTTHL